MIKQAPDYLDNARVRQWAWSGTEPFGFVSDRAIYGLALATYENENKVYRFSCDADWQVIQDDCYESIAEAISLLPKQYQNQNIIWQKK